MRRLPAKIISPALQFFIKHYFKKPRNYSYKTIKGIVLPGNYDLKEKRFLELGCGTGLISVFAAKNGANVLSSDINPVAIENANLNAINNKIHINTVISDLFEKIPSEIFDFIIINPPYYPKTPKNHAEEAWFCGEHFEYFEKLFPSLPQYFGKNSNVFMILSEDCDFSSISKIALKNKVQFKEIFQQRKYGEISLIYQLTIVA